MKIERVEISNDKRCYNCGQWNHMVPLVYIGDKGLTPRAICKNCVIEASRVFKLVDEK